MKEFFNETGKYSMARLLSFILVISGIIYAFIFRDISIASMMIGIGMTGKVSQKLFESKNGK